MLVTLTLLKSKTIRLVSVIPLLLALYLLPACEAGATSVVMVPDDALIEHSVAIVTGYVIRIESYWEPQQEGVFTQISLSVEDILKGGLNVSQLTLNQAGGRVGDLYSWIHGNPEFAVGEKVLLFLRQNPDRTLRVAHLYQGKFSILEDSQTREEFAHRETPAGLHVFSLPAAPGGIPSQKRTVVPLREFKNRIREQVQRAARGGQTLTKSADVMFSSPLPSSQSQSHDKFTFLPTPSRWFEPDSFNSVPILINSAGQPGAPTGGFEQVRGALQAWSIITGTNFRFQDSGLTSEVGFRFDGVNAVSFGDPLGQMDNPVGCSGTLAIGGASGVLLSETKTVNGQSFARIIEGDVVFNNGWEGCGFYENFANFTEVAAHELGHVLGLGHSADADATMYFLAHFDGRGASLHEDDIEGLRFIYPGTSLALINLAADKASPQPLGTTTSFTATSSGGSAPIQFKWWIFNGSVWSVGQNWSTSNTFNWTPTAAGDYIIGVWARSSGNTADAPENNALRTMSFSITGPAGLTVTNLTANNGSPQPLGTTTTFTATSSGGTAPIQFKWWIFNGSVWSVGQNWSTSNTFNWTPTAAGDYIIGVWARSSGNTADAPENNALRTMSFTITGPAGAQVRFFNDLLICNPDCTSFTARLTASEGYTWLSASGIFSAYQSVSSPTLSNFVGEAVEFGIVVNFPGPFSIMSARRYALVLTLDGASNPTLLLFDEGSITLTVTEQLVRFSDAITGSGNDNPGAHLALPLNYSFARQIKDSSAAVAIKH